MTLVGSPRQRTAVSVTLALLLALTLSLAGISRTFAVAAAQPASAAAPAAPVAPADDEAAFFNAINQSRNNAGLGSLSNDGLAAQVARAWSGQMASRNQLQHNPNLQADVERQVTTAWQRIGENVGVGYSVTGLHDAFMNSPGHRANIMGEYNRVGVGVVRESSGRIWVTMVYLKGPAIASAAPAPSGSSPRGTIDVIQRVPGALRVSGWSLDLDTEAPTDVHVYVGGRGQAVRADRERLDIAAVFPGYGAAHGFDVTVPVFPGSYDVCVYGINAAGGGGTSPFGCRRVEVGGTPVGSIDVARWSLGTVTVAGWALDPDVEWGIDTHVYVDGVGVNVKADRARGDIAGAFPGYGAGHGFSATIPVGGGRHTICVYGIGAGLGGNSLLGCRTIDAPSSPIGAIDGITRGSDHITVSGWALDPETAQPIPVHLYARGVGQAVTADVSRPDIASAFPGYGDRHGFWASVPVADGPVEVCAYAIGVGVGGNSLLGCRTV